MPYVNIFSYSDDATYEGFLKFVYLHTLYGRRLHLDALSFIYAYSGLKLAPIFWNVTGIQVFTSRFRKSSLLVVTCKNSPSARRASVVNLHYFIQTDFALICAIFNQLIMFFRVLSQYLDLLFFIAPIFFLFLFFLCWFLFFFAFIIFCYLHCLCVVLVFLCAGFITGTCVVKTTW